MIIYKDKNKAKSSPVKRRLLIATLIIVFAASTLFVLEKADVINLYGKKGSPEAATEDKRGVNDVDYSPANSTDNDDINAKKDSGEIDQTPTPPTHDTAVQITYIASDQSGVPGGPLVVKLLLGDITDGNCLLTLSKDGEIINKNAPIIQQNNYFTCDGFNIPYAELSTGEWSLTVKVISNDGRSNEASTKTNIQ